MPELSLPAVAKPSAPPAARSGMAALFSRSYAALEARRNRVLYAGWPLIVLGSVPFTWLIARAAGLTGAQGVSGALLAWTAVGLPVTAVLFGAVAGAGLRRKAAEDEAALPLSPRARAFAALGAAAAAFAVVALTVLALTSALSHNASGALRFLLALGNDWASLGLLALTVAALGALSVAWLLAVSFEVAFAASHAVLGGVAAAFGAGLALLPLAAGCAMFVNAGGGSPGLFIAAALASAAAGTAGALVSLGGAAPTAARRGKRRWPALAAMVLLPFAGSLVAWPALFHARTELLAASSETFGPLDPKTPDLNIQRARYAGFERSLGGRLVFRRASGETVLLPGASPTLADLVLGRDLPMVTTAFRDRDGRAWADVFTRSADANPGFHEIWQGMPDKPLTRYMTMSGDYELCLFGGRAAVNVEPLTVGVDKNYVPLDPSQLPRLGQLH